MEPKTKTVAEVNRRLLKAGFVQLEDVCAWADEQIAALSVPPYWMIAVSMARTSEDAIAALDDASGEVDAVGVWGALTQAWLTLLQSDPDRDSKIAKQLYYLGMERAAPIQGLDGELMSFWDAIDLAREGQYGSIEAERERLRTFLRRWSSGEPPNPELQRTGPGPAAECQIAGRTEISFHDRPPIRARVLAVLNSTTVRVVLGPGEVHVDSEVPCELAMELVPPALRFPGTKLWVELDGSGNVLSARLRAES